MTKRKERKLQALEEAKRLKEIEAKINIKRTLNKMKGQSQKFEQFKNECIDKARKASLINDTQNYNLAKMGLKFALKKQRVIDTMISNFEISMQVNDMNNVIKEFVNSASILSNKMKMTTSLADMTKAQLAYDQAIANNAGQYEALDVFLSTALDSMEAMESDTNDVTDKEIDALITNQAVDSETQYDEEIDNKINAIRNKITPEENI